MLAFGDVARFTDPRPSFDDGGDLATCSNLENGHLRYLRDLWANCDVWVTLCSFSVPPCLCGCSDEWMSLVPLVSWWFVLASRGGYTLGHGKGLVHYL
jgi:hypothetical protein